LVCKLLTNLVEVDVPRVASRGKPAGPAPAADRLDVNAAATLDFAVSCGATTFVVVGFDLKLRARDTELARRGISPEDEDIFSPFVTEKMNPKNCQVKCYIFRVK